MGAKLFFAQPLLSLHIEVLPDKYSHLILGIFFRLVCNARIFRNDEDWKNLLEGVSVPQGYVH